MTIKHLHCVCIVQLDPKCKVVGVVLFDMVQRWCWFTLFTKLYNVSPNPIVLAAIRMAYG